MTAGCRPVQFPSNRQAEPSTQANAMRCSSLLVSMTCGSSATKCTIASSSGEHVSFLGAGYDRVFVVNSFSKTFAAGWRMVRHRRECRTHEAGHEDRYYLTACPNDAMQYAVLAAIEPPLSWRARQGIQARCDLITDRLNAMQCAMSPSEGFHLRLPGHGFPVTSEELALGAQDGVLCSPGTAFGPSGEGHLRFAYTIGREDIAQGMDLFEATLHRLRG